MQNDNKRWNSNDTKWVFSLYGTAIGAGVLFLPVNAGRGGLIPILVMLVLSFPLTFLTHRALCRFVLGGSEKSDNITMVGEAYFGKAGGVILTLLYFFAIFPILLVYSVGITNNISSFVTHQLGIADMEAHRLALSFIIVAVLMAVVCFGRNIIVNAMSIIVFPFIIVLMISALWLIPKWNTSLFQNISFGAVNGQSMWMVILLILPTMIFAFNHSPIISTLAVNAKERYGDDADEKASKIIAFSNILMIITVMFFVFSCAMCLSPEQFQEAKDQNLPILSYLANEFGDMKTFAYLAPIIAFVAMSKSFFGHYLGSKEGLDRIIFYVAGKNIPQKIVSTITAITTFIVCWFVAYEDPNVLGIIESIGGPILAILLFIMPLYAIYRFKQLHKYKNFWQNIFILAFGIVIISTAIYNIVIKYI